MGDVKDHVHVGRYVNGENVSNTYLLPHMWLRSKEIDNWIIESVILCLA